MRTYDSRAYLPEYRVALEADGNVITFEKDGLTLFAKSGADTTAVSCPPYADLPHGLRFTVDNSHGSGSLTMTPTSGTATVVAAGKVYDYYVTAAGTLKATELAAMPT